MWSVCVEVAPPDAAASLRSFFDLLVRNAAVAASAAVADVWVFVRRKRERKRCKRTSLRVSLCECERVSVFAFWSLFADESVCEACAHDDQG